MTSSAPPRQVSRAAIHGGTTTDWVTRDAPRHGATGTSSIRAPRPSSPATRRSEDPGIVAVTRLSPEVSLHGVGSGVVVAAIHSLGLVTHELHRNGPALAAPPDRLPALATVAARPSPQCHHRAEGRAIGTDDRGRGTLGSASDGAARAHSRERIAPSVFPKTYILFAKRTLTLRALRIPIGALSLVPFLMSRAPTLVWCGCANAIVKRSRIRPPRGGRHRLNVSACS